MRVERIVKPVYACGISLILMALTGGARLPSVAVYNIDPGRSRIEIDVFKGGLFKVFGHDHKIAAKRFSGTVRYDAGSVDRSAVSLSIEADSLTVLDPPIAEKERSEVQATMDGVEVLDVKAFPRIVFSSTQVSHVKQTADGSEVMLAGRLNLHGVEREIAFPIHLRVQEGMLRATGTALLAQSDFGIAPVRVMGGTVRVKDQVHIDFDIVAGRANP